MKTKKHQFIQLKLSQLIVNKEHYRHSLDRYLNKHLTNELEAIQKFCDKDNQYTLLKLMKSIVSNGFCKRKYFIITKENSNSDKYLVLDGNRRLTAIKILNDSNLVPNESKKIKKFAIRNQKILLKWIFGVWSISKKKTLRKK
ncbi:hypothetical protein [Candidatus Phytoplasma australiense]|uniref:ParB/Sulfiredoxin domain-containing protein n=1 Tax=Strawberry lethal yellows phytoplasma (CPA) str. NZSb11 TaxID=980422 RepID=R4RMB0_PHYAS|nr:hypothetical protein [Candidatus Phytoplasma australiense]AGL90435.1 Hypothetical Protein SLY_0516 [Strawberry lethal yellows phytoplasma (CPA) str. NZSb11]